MNLLNQDLNLQPKVQYFTDQATCNYRTYMIYAKLKKKAIYLGENDESVSNLNKAA